MKLRFRLVEDLNTETLLEARNAIGITEKEKQFLEAHRELLKSNDVNALLDEYWKIEADQKNIHHFYAVLIKMAGADFLLKHMTTIPHEFFMGDTTVRDIVIPENIEGIYSWAFANSSIHKIIYADNSVVNIISSSCFHSASFLTEVSLPDRLVDIDDSAFYGCPISNIFLPSSLHRIGVYAFATTNIQKITIPESVEIIGSNCFRESCLKEVTWEKSNKDVFIGRFAFRSANEHVMKFNCFHNTSAEKYAKENGYEIEYLD